MTSKIHLYDQDPLNCRTVGEWERSQVRNLWAVVWILAPPHVPTRVLRRTCPAHVPRRACSAAPPRAGQKAQCDRK
jgi:hypothetical protein